MQACRRGFPILVENLLAGGVSPNFQTEVGLAYMFNYSLLYSISSFRAPGTYVSIIPLHISSRYGDRLKYIGASLDASNCITR